MRRAIRGVAIICCIVAAAAIGDVALLVCLAILAAAGMYLLGRRHGAARRPRKAARKGAQRQASGARPCSSQRCVAGPAIRSAEDAEQARLVAELEQLSARSLEEVVSSYRVIARNHKTTRRRP